jgi:mRNA interferase RelE/StbE
MAYSIQWDIRAYRELKAIQNKDAVGILNAVSKLQARPTSTGRPLEGKFKGKFRIRVGDYRVIYWVNDAEQTIYIISLGHRKDIYKEG